MRLCAWLFVLVAVAGHCGFAVGAGASKAELAPNTPEAAEQAAAAAKDLPPLLEGGRPLLFIPMLEAPKALTGDLKNPVWGKAASFKMVSFEGGEIVPAKFLTVARVFCTQEAIYVGVRCEDPDTDNLVTSNPAAWNNDSVEFFIYPGESAAGGKLYYQVVVDARKTMEFYHTHNYPKHRYKSLQNPWKPDVDAEIAKDDKGWTVELKLKFSDLELTDEARAKKTPWRMDLFRNRKARGGVGDQSYAWIPTEPSGQYHLPTRYGYILPAAYATPELVAGVAARAKAQGVPDAAPPAYAIGQINDLISRLGNDDYSVRNAAMLNLTAMLDEKKPLAPVIQSILKKTLAQTDDSEVKLRSIKVLKVYYQGMYPDDDIPPDEPDVNQGGGGL